MPNIAKEMLALSPAVKSESSVSLWEVETGKNPNTSFVVVLFLAMLHFLEFPLCLDPGMSDKLMWQIFEISPVSWELEPTQLFDFYTLYPLYQPKNSSYW